MSLRTRLFLSHAIAIVIGLLALFVALSVLLRDVQIQRTQNQLAARALDQARFGRVVQNDNNPQRLFDRMRRFASERRSRVMLLDDQRAVIADSAPDPQASMIGKKLTLNRKIVSEDANDDETFVGEFRDAANRRFLFASVRLPQNNQAEWFVLSQVANAPLLGFIDELTRPLLQSLVIGLLFGAVAAALVARSIAKPIQHVSEAARAISAGDYSQRVKVDSPFEVKQLADDFNHMVERVKSAQQTERDFVANVSHELKTPLTSIQGFAQAIRDGDASDTQHAASIIFDESTRLQRLVNTLLDSARIESGAAQMSKNPLDINDVASACVTKLQPRAQEAGLTLSAQLAGGLPKIVGDGDRLAQVLTNLIDNAIKHTERGKVTVETKAVKNGVEIGVSDTGGGIPPDDLPHIFDRFYQADKSRSGGKGSGLGLAICKQIVDAHGGKIDAQSVMGLGTRVAVWLPEK
jgi:signal transduction histidine kinase